MAKKVNHSDVSVGSSSEILLNTDLFQSSVCFRCGGNETNRSVNLTMPTLNEKRQGSGVTNAQETIDAAGQTTAIFPISPMR